SPGVFFSCTHRPDRPKRRDAVCVHLQVFRLPIQRRICNIQYAGQVEQPGLDLISRRPPKQKFANFEDYLAAHGGMTVPLPPEASDAADTPETATLAEAAE
uniref:hypothetical protein n=1 Tax=Gemmiger formicilis TaxID=745368 RepID=UPI004029059F